MDENYSVLIEPFAEKHYIKQFERKYHRAWIFTMAAITRQLERVDNLTKTNIAEIITTKGNFKIIKTDFKIAGSKESTKTSGNRTIVSVDEEKRIVSVLLVYHKNDVQGKHETVWWKNMITENYPKYKDLI